MIVLIRLALLGAMAWLTYKDIQMKGIQYRFFTVWGAYSTLLFFFLMFIVSIQKLVDHIKYERASDKEKQARSILKDRTWWSLNAFTAFWFHWCFNSEFVITACFWIWLWVVGTDVSKLSSEQVRAKLAYDLFKDPENYDHSLPLALLVVEYSINNIPFIW